MLRQSESYRVHYSDLKQLPMEDEALFFEQLYHDLITELGPLEEAELELLGGTPRSAFDFQTLLIQLVSRSELNVVLFLDNIEMAPPNLVASLLGVLRSTFILFTDHASVRFQAVVCGSLSLSQVSLNNASRFESVSKLVMVHGLDLTDRIELVEEKCRNAGITPINSGVAALTKQTAGDPFLIEEVLSLALEEMRAEGYQKLLPKRVETAVETFFERHSIEKHWIVEEVLLQIDASPSLLKCALMLLQDLSLPGDALPINAYERPTVLDLCGAFSFQDGDYRIKSPIWRRLIESHLNAAHVGGLFAVFGDWDNAIIYLSRAVLNGNNDAKSELFTAIINAMHTTERIDDAFQYLGRGLAQVYPDQPIEIYRNEVGKLVGLFPDDMAGKALYHHQQELPEIASVHGPEYSLMMSDGRRKLFVPMRPGGIKSKAIGLIVVETPQFVGNTYRLRQEMRLLTELAQQAANALRTKGSFLNLFAATHDRAQKLNTMNGLLTQILNHSSYDETLIFRLVLAWITAGDGLKFNRALLFMQDSATEELVGQYAVGQRTLAEAQQVWEEIAHIPFEKLVSQILATGGQDTSLNEPTRQLRFKLNDEVAASENLLIDVYNTGRPFHSTDRYELMSIFGDQLNRLPQVVTDLVGMVRDFALLPLNTGRDTIGILYVDNHFSGDRIQEDDYELLQTFLNQVGLVIENIWNLRTEQTQKSKLAELLQIENELSQLILDSPYKMLDRLVDSARRLLRADSAVIYPLRAGIDRNQFYFELEDIVSANTWYPLRPNSNPHQVGTITYEVIQKGRYVVNDTAVGTTPSGLRLATVELIQKEEIASFVAVRLGSIESPVGIIFINWRALHYFTPEEETLLEVFANFAAVAITSARSHERVKTDLARRDQEISGLSSVIYAGLEPENDSGEKTEEVIRWALQAASEMASTERVFLVRNESRGWWSRYTLDRRGHLHRSRQEALHEGVIRQAFESGETQSVVNGVDLAGRPHADRLISDSQSALSIPVKVEEQRLAILHVESTELTFADLDREFLERLSDRLAISLKQTDQSRTLRRLLDISLKFTQRRGLEGVLKAVVDQAMEGLSIVDMIVLFHRNREGDLVLGEVENSNLDAAFDRYQPAKHPIVHQIFAAHEPLFANEPSRFAPFADLFPPEEEVFALAAFPLVVEQEHMGVIFFLYRYRHNFGVGEKSLLKLFAQMAAVAIRYADINQEVDKQRERLKIVEQFARDIAALEPERVGDTLLNKIQDFVPNTDNVCVIEYNELTGVYALAPFSRPFYHADHNLKEKEFIDFKTAGLGIARRAMDSGETIIVSDVLADPDYFPTISTTRAEMCVPITIGDTRRGVIVLESDQIHAFSHDDKLLLEMVADHVAIALQNALRYQDLKSAKRLGGRGPGA